MLGLRCTFALGLLERWAPSLEDVGFPINFVVRRSWFGFCGDIGGEVAGGVGEAALTRGFFAFFDRNFSSSSDVVTSERLEWSTLMASELRLEMTPKDGAHFSGDPGGYSADPAKDSARLIRCTRGSTPGCWMSEELEMEESDLRRRGIRETESHELWELSVVELAEETSVLEVRRRGEVRT